MSRSKTKKGEIQHRNYEHNEEIIRQAGLIRIITKSGKGKYMCSKCNNIVSVKRKSIKRNPICSNCMTGKSFGEEKVIEILTKHNIAYQKEKSFRGLKGLNNGLLRFDFYIKGTKHNFVLEIDGDQHRNDSEWGGNTKVHDEIKDQFCKERNVQLYRVKYQTGKLIKLENEIRKILKLEFPQLFNYMKE